MSVAQGRIRQRVVARYDYLGRSHERCKRSIGTGHAGDGWTWLSRVPARQSTSLDGIQQLPPGDTSPAPGSFGLGLSVSPRDIAGAIDIVGFAFIPAWCNIFTTFLFLAAPP